MKRICTEDDIRFHKSLMPPEAPCGRTYDDMTHLTTCPHNPLPRKLTEEELQDLFDQVNNKKENPE